VEEDWFGSSVELSDDIAVIGAYGDDDFGEQSGSAYTWNLSDTDGDGVGDECDLCPDTPAGFIVDEDGCTASFGSCCIGDQCVDRIDQYRCEVTARGFYQGDGMSCDGDYDSDGAAGCDDGCPFDWHKTDPGVCGCGVADVDDDSDGVMDCVDQCPGPHGHTPVNDCGCPAVGACCSFGGSCRDDTERDDCVGDFDAYQGDGSSCFGGCDFGDLDGDNDVDLADFSILQTCFSGAGSEAPRECLNADIDGCSDLDLEDFAFFSEALDGP
jgi:hypothetical protein